MDWKDRYIEAHRQFQNNYPNAVKDHGYIKTEVPKVATANGLTNFIEKFLMWRGHRATRINTQGQYVQEKYGKRIISKGWRPSVTRKGTADISATINGKSVMIEIKAGRDKPSDAQLAEQARERAAGGIYEFIHTPEEFFELYDRIFI